MKQTTLSGSSLPKRNAIANFIVTKRITIIEIISALFILLFSYTAINKFLDLDRLKYVLKDYPLLGNFSLLIAWGLPTVESLLSIILIIPRTRIMGLIGALGMMTFFTLYLIYLLIFAPIMPCTCGGMLQQMTWPQHLIFNVFFIALAFTGIRLYKMKTTNMNRNLRE